MDGKEYSVSDAVRLIGVESHVLRYWEEELQIEIRRNSQGHRVYSAENIHVFRRVRELKEKGLQLKAIRLLLDGEGKFSAAPDTGDDEFARQVREFAGEYLFGESCEEQDGVYRETERENREEQAEAERESREEEMGAARESRRKDIRTERGDQEKEAEAERESREEAPEAVYCEVIPLRQQEDDLYPFKQILRRLIEEVVSEQNEKLEDALAGRMKEEFEDFYLQWYQTLQEAAASREPENRHGRLWHTLNRLLRRER